MTEVFDSHPINSTSSLEAKFPSAPQASLDFVLKNVKDFSSLNKIQNS